ncbi:inorganic pyrophosphatase [Floricoccus penangensis]|uniref:Inorganic pyrophosphatase n=1 Tax=Floricoccus penangensis TaxID=1859475 RepID=A0A9Q5JFT3_9LACT|nr:inorganic pyrophosphatase [Floricoccus penangensis]OFI46259.1 inorganic pyrophosphatase [Floricoccus penangensis]
MERLQLKVTIDRPIGYKNDFGNIYPINYGYIAGVIAGDGEEQDAYVLSTSDEPLKEFTGYLVAIIRRKDDVEDKWVVAEANQTYSAQEIYQAVEFLEKYFDSEIELVK